MYSCISNSVIPMSIITETISVCVCVCGCDQESNCMTTNSRESIIHIEQNVHGVSSSFTTCQVLNTQLSIYILCNDI